MKFPEMTITTINLPRTLLDQIDQFAQDRMLNRSASIRLLTQQGLKDAMNGPGLLGVI